MRILLAASLALLAAQAAAATAYVSDELVLGVYTEQNNQGQRLTTLHSGAGVETLNSSGDFTQVRLNDGTTGWVKSSYLTTRQPATARVKELEEELDRSRATSPALAEAAARSEMAKLNQDLAETKAQLQSRPVAAAPDRVGATGTILALAAAAAAGFWLGYTVLARRVRHKFGGIKVY